MPHISQGTWKNVDTFKSLGPNPLCPHRNLCFFGKIPNGGGTVTQNRGSWWKFCFWPQGWPVGAYISLEYCQTIFLSRTKWYPAFWSTFTPFWVHRGPSMACFALIQPFRTPLEALEGQWKWLKRHDTTGAHPGRFFGDVLDSNLSLQAIFGPPFRPKGLFRVKNDLLDAKKAWKCVKIALWDAQMV